MNPHDRFALFGAAAMLVFATAALLSVGPGGGAVLYASAAVVSASWVVARVVYG